MTTKIKWSITLLLLIALGGWIASRWNTWFGNQPEPAYTVEKAPHRIMLTMGNNSERSRIVTWQADTIAKDGELKLYYQPAGGEDVLKFQTIKADCEIVASRSGKVAFYRAELNELPKSENGYRFNVKVGNLESGYYRFDLQKNSTASFIFMGDVQDSAKGLSHDLFKTVDASYPETDFWMFGGDLVERPMDNYWQVVFDDLDSIATRKPILSISGNHEYLKGLIKELDPRIGQVFGYYQNSKVGDNHVFTFPYGEARFFLLDSNVDFWNLPKQHEWLKKALENSTEKWKIVVLHHPLYSNKGKHYNPMVKLAFGDLIKEYGVDLVLQGHEHVYARWNDKDNEGNYIAPVYLSSVCSPKQYQLHFSEPEDRIGTNDRFFQHISYNADSLSIWTFMASDGKAYDHICIRKDNSKYKVQDFYKDQPQKVEIPEWFKQSKKRHVKEYQKEIDEWKKRNNIQ